MTNQDLRAYCPYCRTFFSTLDLTIWGVNRCCNACWFIQKDVQGKLNEQQTKEQNEANKDAT